LEIVALARHADGNGTTPRQGARGAARSVTKPRAAAQRSRARTSSTCSRFGGDQVQVKKLELAAR